MIQVDLVRLRELNQGLHDVITRTPQVQDAATRAISDELAGLVRDQIDGSGISDPFGFVYEGDLLESTVGKVLTKGHGAVIQSDLGNFIMSGTKAKPDATKPPYPLVEWVERKLSPDNPYPVALTIFRHGLLADSRAHYPSGNSGFNYAQWVMEQGRGMDVVEKYAAKAGDILVSVVASRLSNTFELGDFGVT